MSGCGLAYKQTVYRVPCDGVEMQRCRLDRQYTIASAVPVPCSFTQSSGRVRMVDGESEGPRARIESSDKFEVDDRVFLSKSDFETGDLEFSMVVVGWESSPHVLTSHEVYLTRLEG